MSRTRTRWFTVAAAAIVVAGLLPGTAALADVTPGAIAGHLLDGPTPVANATVDVLDSNFFFVGQATTDASGAYTVTDIPPGAYIVQFELPGGLSQYSHQKLALGSADSITVTAGATTQLEETVVPHGAIAGTLTSSAGAPVPNAFVNASTTSGDLFVSGQTDAAGHYVLPYVPAGTWTVSFFDPASGVSQAAHQKLFEPGDPFTVTAGATTTVDEQLVPTGAVEGHVTLANGAPAAFTQVYASSQFTGKFTTTDASGFYHLDAIPGSYKVSFILPSSRLTEWAHQKTTEFAADPITITANATTTVDEQFLPTGILTGHLLAADGNPVSFTQVAISANNQQLTVFTTPSGDWTADVFPGTYKVSFQTQTGVQWATGKTSAATADSFAVAVGQTVHVDDRIAAAGSVTVTVHDSITGQLVPDYCVGVVGTFSFPCTTNGTVNIPAVLPGAQQVEVFMQGNYTNTAPVTVNVSSGQNTNVDVLATPGATLTTTVRDAKTGTPLSHICLQAIPTTSPSGVANGLGNCTDASGVMTIGQLAAGAYNVFAYADDGVHGHQWVGPLGGVGAQKKARITTVTAGQAITLPDIKMDKRGTLTGIVRDKVTGAPIPGAVVGFATSPAGLGGSSAEVSTDGAGRYTFTNLGPYEWPIFFKKAGYASEWSGNTGNRLKANPIQVKAGKTKNHDERLSRGVTVTGSVTTATGGPIDLFAARISVISESRDEIGVSDTDANGRYSVQVLPRQSVLLNVAGSNTGVPFAFFYPHAADFEHATSIKIQKPSPLTINITLPPAS